MSDYKSISTSVFPGVTNVRVYEETLQHIQKEHPEVPILLPSLQSALENTLSNPTHIEKSYGNSYVYVDGESTNAGGDPFRVPVKVIEGTSARLKTSYFASVPAGANVVWRRDENG